MFDRDDLAPKYDVDETHVTFYFLSCFTFTSFMSSLVRNKELLFDERKKMIRNGFVVKVYDYKEFKH